ncbi:MAG: GatB/YqeY domain-containing protein [Rhodobiaceae bacterium]|nr:Yqey-like protein [Rhodobiaceae bacterium]MCR9241501.1 GatB/YqeY domain-containing protein [Rhodobiaceae bacterium]|tara:strand:+ start:431 stop:886 length:456 start_codon:yes stop_codon:yes gene_type:complete
MREEIKAALKEALKAQDKRRMGTIRLMQAAIKDRDIAARTEGADTLVSDDDILAILAKMIKQREESAVTYENAGRAELATQEREEIEVIKGFMPTQLTPEEVEAAAAEVVAELGAESLKDMGRCMGELKKRYAGRMDFGKAGAVIKGKLGG